MKKLKFFLFAVMGVIAIGLSLLSCEQGQVPVQNPQTHDSIPTPDTIIPTDTIVPVDTIPILVDTIIIGTDNMPGESLCEGHESGAEAPGPYAYLTIVKFYNEGQEKKVIVQHPIKKYNGIDGKYEYYENTDLYLNILPKQYTWENGCGLDPTLVNWADEEMGIAGTSPYISLTDGYYLIDWKWHQLFPVSALTDDNRQLSEHIRNHVFMTDMDWNNLNTLTDRFDASRYTQHLKGIEIIRVWAKELTCLFNDTKNDPYVCWNMSIYYNNGMCYENAHMYYQYGDCAQSGKTHQTYVAFCDSLQSVYKNYLIELINNGQLKTIGY